MRETSRGIPERKTNVGEPHASRAAGTVADIYIYIYIFMYKYTERERERESERERARMTMIGRKSLKSGIS